MNYEIIRDEGQLREFIAWLPDLEADETYLLCLLARKKYAPPGAALRDDKAQLKRVTATKESLLQKIRQMEGAIGSYVFKGGPVPQEALALYITLNPRSLTIAARQLLIELAHRITQPYNGYNPQSLALTEIQKAAGRKPYFDFDLDGVGPAEVLAAVRGNINLDALTVLLTRGGLHVLVEVGRIQEAYRKNWYQTMQALPGCDVRGDNLIPVPGCTQGGFTPSFLPAWA
ncbi:hypothetical protein QMK33_00645 [Hymenobacter sp. H14-R3]|uniref:hypothetical protein n=1 Tax=Hymenobacter sp. H14-R3 TaxID=3046308 RepID=UPI0024B88E1D|nr:hypothetical protein [Hymenobacter sp. H14-R3]MDJ0363643.1 hypothetical protein [Hymenobacter sp. H14-R3]